MPAKPATLAALLGALALPVAAQEAVPCADHWAAQLIYLSEPLEESTRTYAEGAVRVLIMTSPEPACCGVFPAVLLPDVDGFRVCRIVPVRDGDGWGGLSFDGQASYDPARGLTIPMTATVWDGEAFVDEPVALTVNQSTKRVMVEPR